MNSIDFENRLKAVAFEFEEYFKNYFKFDDVDLSAVGDAMCYSAQSGGKRIRPFIVVEVCRMLGGDIKKALVLASALECVHTYSLIHDDLPCMDNDDFRRGRPTCHMAYGEEYALLAGDALLTYAFEIIVKAQELCDGEKAEAVRLLSSLAGLYGMVGGQTIDLKSEGKQISMDKLIKLHSLKTGALMRCAALMGALAAGADEKQRTSVDEYAKSIGLAFQIADDILDVSANEAELGKPVGSDADNKKVTFITFMSCEEAYKYAKELVTKACAHIEEYENSDVLTALATYIIDRRK